MTFLLVASVSGCDVNKGEDTTCRDFAEMSASERHDVIEKMGYAPEYTTCRRRVKTDPLSTVESEPPA